MADNEDKCERSNHEIVVFMRLLSGIISLGIVLILGSYGYTWVEARGEQTEKRDWRRDHQSQLDKQIIELKRGQERLEDSMNRSSEETRRMLQRILDEQGRLSSEKFGGRDNRDNRR